MSLYENLINKKEKLSVIGLGYVGIPLAVAFSKYVDVVGFDINKEKIDTYLSGIDPTKEIGNDAIKDTGISFTWDSNELKKVKFHIIAVPTPINLDKTPDLKPLEKASTLLGKNLAKGSIVVYESTVYPGVTEDVCIPILEKESGLKCGVDFKVGYSPERINPSDKEHTLSNIIKVVSGIDNEALEEIAKTYELVAKNGVHRASCIKVAEAAKVIENSQRDINIAFMNELSIIFNKLGIDTKDVLTAAATKWNFIKFVPGLVGGHCIGVDPYYLTYKAEQLGYHSQIILSGRKINDNMGKYVGENIIKSLIREDISIKNAQIAIFGFTFKENCQDTRNTKIIDIINELNEYGVSCIVVDPVADKEEAKLLYNIDIKDSIDDRKVDLIAVCVNHKEFLDYDTKHFDSLYNNKKIIFDIKGIYDKNQLIKNNYIYWSL